ncbi:anti-sigma factor family protein [Petrachloros mirabilis]
MTRKQAGRTTSRRSPAHTHSADETRCLDIIKQISAYIDDELPIDICRELRRHLGACPNCEKFVASLQQTVSLCRHCDTPALSAQDRASLRLEILRNVRSR